MTRCTAHTPTPVLFCRRLAGHDGPHSAREGDQLFEWGDEEWSDDPEPRKEAER